MDLYDEWLNLKLPSMLCARVREKKGDKKRPGGNVFIKNEVTFFTIANYMTLGRSVLESMYLRIEFEVNGFVR